MEESDHQAIKELIAQALEQCINTDLLDLVYKLLITTDSIQ